MGLDLHPHAAGLVPPSAPPATAPRRWSVLEDRGAVRIVVWGRLTRTALGPLDARVAALRAGFAPVVVDLTGVTEIDEDAIAWLGARHQEFGRERPMLVVVLADGYVHDRLTRRDAPRLRLTLT